MKSAAFLTLGCKVNAYETNGMEKIFRDSGYEIKDFSQKADIYVINTCTVTNMADRKSRQMIHKAKKMNPQAVIAAVGCYVQASREEAENDPSIDLVIGNNQKSKIVYIIEEYMENQVQRSYVGEMKSFQEYEEITIERAGEKTRAYIKIQDGCNQFCSYCIIPYVRGRIRSRKEEDIVKEIEGLVTNGYKEVVLTGIHLSSYGVDLQGETDFTKLSGKPLLALIKRVSGIKNLRRIRLGSLEPRIISEDFANELSSMEKVCPHFHLSLQSGCDATLERMNRKYTADEYFEKCTILRKYFEQPAITTDLIVGFPEESDEAFENCFRFVKKAEFSDVHIFKYSMRKGTKAAQMEHQIEEQIKTKRSNRLIALGKELTDQYNKAFIGKEQMVLFEEKSEIGNVNYWVGHNERYIKIALPVMGEEDRHNRIVKVRLIKELEDGLIRSELVI